MKIVITWILSKIESFKRKREIKKKIEEIRKRDPFTYNH
jgi:hypothetical protein